MTPTGQNLRFSNRAATSVPSGERRCVEPAVLWEYGGFGRTPSGLRSLSSRRRFGHRWRVSVPRRAQSRMQSEPAAATPNRASGQRPVGQGSANWYQIPGNSWKWCCVERTQAGSGVPFHHSGRSGETQQQQTPPRQAPQSQPNGGYGQQARPQQAPAPAQTAPRSAPAGGNRGPAARGGRR